MPTSRTPIYIDGMVAGHTELNIKKAAYMAPRPNFDKATNPDDYDGGDVPSENPYYNPRLHPNPPDNPHSDSGASRFRYPDTVINPGFPRGTNSEVIDPDNSEVIDPDKRSIETRISGKPPRNRNIPPTQYGDALPMSSREAMDMEARALNQMPQGIPAPEPFQSGTGAKIGERKPGIVSGYEDVEPILPFHVNDFMTLYRRTPNTIRELNWYQSIERLRKSNPSKYNKLKRYYDSVEGEH